MSPPKQRPASPIESVELKVTFSTTKVASARMKELVPGLRLRGRGCEITITGPSPADVAAKAKSALEGLKGID